MQRTKGATYERTIVNKFKEHGFTGAERNLMQTAKGGYDIVGVGNLGIECKDHKKLNINAWWQQTLSQCKDDEIPVLIYHIPNTSKSMVQMPLSAVNETLDSNRTVTMDFEDFIYIAREVIL